LLAQWGTRRIRPFTRSCQSGYLPFFLPVNFLRSFNFHFCAMGISFKYVVSCLKKKGWGFYVKFTLNVKAVATNTVDDEMSNFKL